MSTTIVPISDLRREAGRILELLEVETDAVYITHYGRPVAVLIDYQRYENLLAQVRALAQDQQQEIAAAPLLHYARLSGGLHDQAREATDTDAYSTAERGIAIQSELLLTEQERAELQSIADLRGLSQNEVIEQAVGRYLDAHREANRLALLRTARGIWSDRDDLDARALRAEFDREFKG
ncbi:MAG: type II toxin-antitoxin system Phd/YefM family antitoxin [Anaerolineae bacterium]|nr:type II toxin-antitoxin system Phd/YefM family antitoxin [Anaerolineae bacterium]